MMITWKNNEQPVTGANGYEKLEVTNSVKQISRPEGATGAKVYVEQATGNTDEIPLRAMFNAADPNPSESIGAPLFNKDVYVLENRAITNAFRVIGTSADTHILHVYFFTKAQ